MEYLNMILAVVPRTSHFLIQSVEYKKMNGWVAGVHDSADEIIFCSQIAETPDDAIYSLVAVGIELRIIDPVEVPQYKVVRPVRLKLVPDPLP